MLTKETAHKLYLIFSAALIAFGIILGLTGRGQIHLLPGIDVGGQIHFRALHTFTYQSNLLLIVGFIIMAIWNNVKIRRYISVSVILAATFTGLMYNLVLVPFAGAPMFFTSYVNFSTHVLAMILALANYLIFEEKGLLNRRHILAGMTFPGIYWAIYVIIRDIIDFSPYFFMNPNEVGWLAVFVWFGILLLVFAGMGFLLTLYDRNLKKYRMRSDNLEKTP